MKISKFKDMVRAMHAIAKVHATAAHEDVKVYLNGRLVFASYEAGRTQVLELTPGERRQLGQILIARA